MWSGRYRCHHAALALARSAIGMDIAQPSDHSILALGVSAALAMTAWCIAAGCWLPREFLRGAPHRAIDRSIASGLTDNRQTRST